MTKSQRYRSRFHPRNLSEYFKSITDQQLAVPINVQAHLAQHSPRILIYTSTSTLTTSVGTPLYPTFPGYLTGIRLNVAGAPSSTLTCDLLLNGSSMFTSGDTKPTIASGALFGYKRVTGKTHWGIDDYLQVQLTATGSATGPMVVTMEYFTEG